MPKGVYERTEKHKAALKGISHKMPDYWYEGLKTRKKGGSKKGQIPWNTGKKRPEISGELHHNWKGGITAKNKLEREKFRLTIQPLVFKRDNYTCQFCEQYGGYLQVDHLKSWADYPELRFSLNNCQTLCMACHYYKTFKKKLPQGLIWGHKVKDIQNGLVG